MYPLRHRGLCVKRHPKEQHRQNCFHFVLQDHAPIALPDSNSEHCIIRASVEVPHNFTIGLPYTFGMGTNALQRIVKRRRAKYPVPVCVVTFNAETRLFAFTISFPGKPPHEQMDVFRSLEDLLWWVDPHQERIWEDVSDADESHLLVSRAYKPGTVADRT
jgi:hypothetical protein